MITETLVWVFLPDRGICERGQQAPNALIERCDACRSRVNALAVLVNVLSEAHRAPRWFLAAVRGRATQGWSGVAEALATARLIA